MGVGAVLGVPQHRAHATAKPPQQRAMARIGKITKTNTLTAKPIRLMAPVESDRGKVLLCAEKKSLPIRRIFSGRIVRRASLSRICLGVLLRRASLSRICLGVPLRRCHGITLRRIALWRGRVGVTMLPPLLDNSDVW